MKVRPLSALLGIITVLLIIVAVGVLKFSQSTLAREADEYQIYRMLFAKQYEEYTADMRQFYHTQPDTGAFFAVDEKTSIEMLFQRDSDDTTSYESYLRKQGNSVDIRDSAVIDDFMRMNDDRYWLRSDIVKVSHASPVRIKVIRVKQFPDYLHVTPGMYWASFYRKYPKALGIYRVSRVGFNTIRDAGMVYFMRSSGGLSGEGEIIHLKKTNGQWTIVKKAWIWMS